MKNWLFGSILALVPAVAQAQSLTTFGTVGLVEMPSAESAPDADLSSTFSYFTGSLRSTLSFQISPRLSGSFRYSAVEQIKRGGGDLFDRSFDLRYRLIDEGRYRPAVAIGLQDFLGTGVYSGEYVVATKHLTPGLAVTGGLGWGRFGEVNGFANPLGRLDSRFNTRERGFTGGGGVLESARWFRGDAAVFGGVTWRASDRLTFKAEYSTDSYWRETARNLFTRRSPYNFGVDYKVSSGINLQASYLYGDQLGASVTFALNPKKPVKIGGFAKAPPFVRVRSPGSAADLGWTFTPNVQKSLRASVAEALKGQGIGLEAMVVRETKAIVHVRNERYTVGPEAIGRTARVLTQVLPDSVETFKIVPVSAGIPISGIEIKRSDLEVLEHNVNATPLSYKRAKIIDAARREDDLVFAQGLYPKFRWSIGPYSSASYFDPDSPVRVEVGAQLAASYTFAPGLYLSAAVRKRAFGNKHTATRVSDSVIQRVRSDSTEYSRRGDPTLSDLTLNYYFRPGKNLYGRMTAGYIEQMYGGVSSEVLWKPVGSPLAIGAELNYVKQRDFDQLFGFQNYEVMTGHLTGYWDIGNGYHAQASVGRYLAKDLGGTLKLERVFRNGWRIGAYATLTDVSFADFGEGSFDKGLTFTMPLDHFIGSPNRGVYSATVQPLTRDGGARLSVGRLYETVRTYHDPELVSSWGRFWR